MPSSASEISAYSPGRFAGRHLGPRPPEIVDMLSRVGAEDLSELIDQTIPEAIRFAGAIDLPAPLGERQALERMQEIADRNQVKRSLIGLGYRRAIMPGVIQRNILENPGWYTAYTPYQAEIAQGRLEALLNFQTLILDLTGLEIANASLLDEATAVAEAMALALAAHRGKRTRFLVDSGCHPQTIEVVRSRARPLGIEVVVASPAELPINDQACGLVLQLPTSDGQIVDPRMILKAAGEAGIIGVIAADPMALCLLEAPGTWGADVVVGSTQRFGLPMGFGGPHAAYFATRDKYRRQVPGRIVGVSQDRDGNPGLRLALQTREQHIRRDRATSNICTAQVLPAVLASMYAVYHGPEGLQHIASELHRLACRVADGAQALGVASRHDTFFDLVRLETGPATDGFLDEALAGGFNLRRFDDSSVGIAMDEASTDEEVDLLLETLATATEQKAGKVKDGGSRLAAELLRQGAFLEHEVFSAYRSETDMLRYLHRLQTRDLALDTSMIPLGSCTMKLNATTEMAPVTWPGFAEIHPFAPADQTAGYGELIDDLETWLAEITGFDAISLQPNAGSQGEYAGLLVIRAYHESRGEGQRNVCLIPTSAHGTNPASAVMAGLEVVPVACDENGNIDVDDLDRRAKEHAAKLCALMVTYPSTHGVFEEAIRDICRIVHDNGGQVYMDGANMNAQVGLCRPGDFGADVCHLNLHKTFCIPHGGGGPGMGPIGTASHLTPFLPGHPLRETGGEKAIGPISAAPWGSGTILPISWAYIAMMGSAGLTDASRIAILNANYIAKRLEGHYPVLYRGHNGRVAHECILDLRPLKKAGVEVEDVAKRLIDYGFHAPTVSWPVAGTVMVEPTESESQAELDRFCDAMIAIGEEAAAIERGDVALERSALRNAPHTAGCLLEDEWDADYTREQAAFPAPWTREYKYWPPVRRVDNAYGDRHLVCSCVGMEAFRTSE